MWLTRPTFSVFCGYPVEEPPPTAAMNMVADRRHTADATPHSHAFSQPADTFRKHVHEKGAQELN